MAETLASESLAADRAVRVRFAPSPTGDLHVGNIRTALFNWAYARHQRGTFVFRLEDTDRSRSTDEACAAAADTIRWLGLDWDEGPEQGGPHAPYRQSERAPIYAGVIAQLQEDGYVYPCFCTPAEVEARRIAAGRATPGYDNHCRALTAEQLAAFAAEGRRAALRMRMPAGETRFVDLIRGEVVFDNAGIPDFVVVRADGHPLYTLAVAVDDVLMGITHVLRGEDLLSSTPRQLTVYAALGVAAADFPQFGHLPFVMGHDNQKLSKRNGEVSIAWYRREGFLPEAMVNYLALLGWSMPDEREDFSLAELAAAFDVSRVNRNPARFDIKKLEAINGDKIRALEPADFAARLTEFLQVAGSVATPPTAAEEALITASAPLVQERCSRLTEAAALLTFLFVDEAHFHLDPQAQAKVLTREDAPGVLQAACAALAGLEEWDAAAIEAALRAALIDGLGLKPRVAFGPLRVAVTGSSVSPPLFESLELLGKERSLARLRAAS
ncbi:MAG: glutamate--tRNA ligase [Frankiaceae bacterium]